MFTRREIITGIGGTVGALIPVVTSAKSRRLRPPGRIWTPPPHFSTKFRDDFTSLSLRSGGPTRAGLDAGSGTWTPQFYWSQESEGDEHEAERAFYVRPGHPWTGGYPANGQFSVASSILTIKAQRTPSYLSSQLPDASQLGAPAPWITGILSTANSFYFKPPVFVEARMKIPKGRAVWPAFWMKSRNLALRDEIDLWESLNNNSHLMRFGVIWGQESGEEYEEDSGFDPAPADMSLAYHDYGLLWQGGWLRFFIDRRSVYLVQQPAAWGNAFMFIYLNVAIGGPDSFTGVGPDGTTPNPTKLRVDWVQVLGTGATVYVNTT